MTELALDGVAKGGGDEAFLAAERRGTSIIGGVEGSAILERVDLERPVGTKSIFLRDNWMAFDLEGAGTTFELAEAV